MPLALPTITGLKSIHWAPVAVVATHESLVTFNQQVYRWPGQRLAFSADLPVLTKAQAQEWQAFFLRCNGPENTFYFQDSSPGRAILGRALPGGVVENNRQAFTAATTDICTATAHGYVDGDVTRVTTASALPAGLVTATDYYVRYIDANTFKLSLQLGTGQAFTTAFATDANQLTSAGHGRRNGDIVYLYSSAADLPSGLSENTAYYVVNRTTDTIEVATAQAGTPLTMADDGTGTMTWSTTPVVDITGTGTGIHSIEERQSGAAINTRGWRANVENLFKAGDWISISDRMRKVIIDADSDATGDATLTVWPRIGAAFDDGIEIKTGGDARGIFRMTAIPSWTWENSRLVEGVQFAAAEAL
jgi:hypothetical protein